MKITTKHELGPDTLVLGMFAEDKPLPEVKEAIKNKQFNKDKFGKKYSTVIDNQKVFVYSLGKKKEFTANHLRRILGKAIKCVKANKLTSFSTNITKISPLKAEETGRAAAEGLILGNYKFTKYFGKEKQEEFTELKEVTLQGSDAGIKIGTIIAENTNYAKDLVNEPADLVTPDYLEREAKKLKGVSVKVINKAEMKKLGMNALLGVSVGSSQDPKLILIEKKGTGKPTALVGKGITFDAGGLNLKPTKWIEDMKSDMGGAAAVIATMKAIVELGVKKHLIGVIPACENMLGSSAQKPGDIVKAYNGKTIEIGNTDAEGRLILADAMAYAEDKYKPEIIIDIATLTGATIFALGYEAAALIGKDEKLLKSLEDASKRSHDLLWRLPFFEEYQDYMDGKISDLNNVSTKGKGFEAGVITAGVFLSNFVDKCKWAHIDIGGRAFTPIENDYQQIFATGAGVRLFCYYLMG